MENNSKKNQFWILSGVTVFVLLVAWAVGWWMINDSTAQQIQARDSVFSSVTNLPERTIPNPEISGVLDQRKEALTDIVYKIWEERYQAQQSHFQTVLTDKSRDAIEIINKGPAEISALDKDKYESILKEELAGLYAVVNLRKQIVPEGAEQPDANGESGAGDSGSGGRQAGSDDPGAGGAQGSIQVGDSPGEGSPQQSGAGGRGGNAPTQQAPKEPVIRIEYEGIVDWQDKDDVLDTYLRWDSKPTEAQLFYTLEYWAAMYSVLDVIGKTNGPTTHYEAPIKQIRQLRIGRLGPQMEGGPKPAEQAANQPNTENTVGSGGSQRSSAGDDPGGGGNVSSMQVGDSPSGGSSSAAARGGDGPSPAYHAMNGNWGLNGFKIPAIKSQPADEAKLEEFRYVDDNGYPLYAAKDNPHVEFRMIPLYLELVINQDEIDHFFNVAAQSALPIEVQQICAIHSIPESDKDPNGPVDYAPQDVLLKVRGVIYKYQEPNRDNIGKKPAELVAAEADAANP